MDVIYGLFLLYFVSSLLWIGIRFVNTVEFGRECCHLGSSLMIGAFNCKDCVCSEKNPEKLKEDGQLSKVESAEQVVLNPFKTIRFQRKRHTVSSENLPSYPAHPLSGMPKLPLPVRVQALSPLWHQLWNSMSLESRIVIADFDRSVGGLYTGNAVITLTSYTVSVLAL